MFIRHIVSAGSAITLCVALYSGMAYAEKDSTNLAFSKADQLVQDQYGNSLKFYRDLIKNKIVAINFMFTTCTSSCPLSTTIFLQVQKQVGKGAVQFITISVDPVNDTPERLLEFSKKFNIGANWHFITGEKQDIDQLLKQLGVFTPDRNNHTNMVIVGNAAQARWQRLYGFPQADEILTALKKVSSFRAKQ